MEIVIFFSFDLIWIHKSRLSYLFLSYNNYKVFSSFTLPLRFSLVSRWRGTRTFDMQITSSDIESYTEQVWPGMYIILFTWTLILFSLKKYSLVLFLPVYKTWLSEENPELLWIRCISKHFKQAKINHRPKVKFPSL